MIDRPTNTLTRKTIFIAVLAGVMFGLAWIFKDQGTSFTVGFLFATIFWEVCHRLTKGYWFTG